MTAYGQKKKRCVKYERKQAEGARCPSPPGPGTKLTVGDAWNALSEAPPRIPRVSGAGGARRGAGRGGAGPVRHRQGAGAPSAPSSGCAAAAAPLGSCSGRGSLRGAAAEGTLRDESAPYSPGKCSRSPRGEAPARLPPGIPPPAPPPGRASLSSARESRWLPAPAFAAGFPRRFPFPGPLGPSPIPSRPGKAEVGRGRGPEPGGALDGGVRPVLRSSAVPGRRGGQGRAGGGGEENELSEPLAVPAQEEEEAPGGGGRADRTPRSREMSETLAAWQPLPAETKSARWRCCLALLCAVRGRGRCWLMGSFETSQVEVVDETAMAACVIAGQLSNSDT
ncbi:PREDICTED: collagen alpha-1(III) chain-like [Sturnus vulgaris]|uniref:collagen alpha-1(III) chain-like n=1 Tax=Sturnus vulgaris TaxID=9172 RepID=UPI00071A9018|nr:PREDICTED: collagen alpha-1(III) chain-like [Sturnus vulgaris]